MLKISVISPLFNGERFLVECPDSIFHQSYSPVEILVVYDGSNGGFLAVFNVHINRLITEKNVNLKVFTTQNFGAASARNLGTLELICEIIPFIDANGVWFANKLETQLVPMGKSGVDFVCAPGPTLSKGVIGKMTLKIAPDKLGKGFEKGFGVNPILPSGLLFKRRALMEIGLLDTSFRGPSEDYDLNGRIIKRLNGAVVNEPLFFHRVHDRNVSRGNSIGINRDYRLALDKQCVDNRIELLWRLYVRLQLVFRFLKRSAKERIEVDESVLQFQNSLLLRRIMNMRKRQSLI